MTETIMTHKYPKTGRFCDAVKLIRNRHDYVGQSNDGTALYENTSKYPTVKFFGTVKLHGTNASIEMTTEGLFARRRNTVLSKVKDNYGFATFVSELPPRVIELLWKPNHIIYGEWCGKGIQKGMGVHELPKMFVIFAVYDVLNEAWSNSIGFNRDEQALLNMFRIHSTLEFPTYVLDIDMNKPEAYEDQLTTLAENVFDQCPVADCFGVKGHGEGVVWTSLNYTDLCIRFKVKSDRMATTHTPQAKAVPENIADIELFVSKTVTDNRLEQGVLEVVGEGSPDRTLTGVFVKWVLQDIFQEERLLLESNGLVEADVRKFITGRASKHWLSLCEGYE